MTWTPATRTGTRRVTTQPSNAIREIREISNVGKEITMSNQVLGSV